MTPACPLFFALVPASGSQLFVPSVVPPKPTIHLWGHQFAPTLMVTLLGPFDLYPFTSLDIDCFGHDGGSYYVDSLPLPVPFPVVARSGGGGRGGGGLPGWCIGGVGGESVVVLASATHQGAGMGCCILALVLMLALPFRSTSFTPAIHPSLSAPCVHADAVTEL